MAVSVDKHVQADPTMLLTMIGRELGRRLTELLEPTGLKARHMGAMVALRSGPRSQQTLVEDLGVHPAKVVALLNDLETDGLVTRRRDPDDRRRHTVALSELGRARLAAVDVAREKLDAALFAEIGPAKRTLLTSLLQRVGENIGITACSAAPNEEAD